MTKDAVGTPSVFLSRIIDTTDKRKCVQVFDGRSGQEGDDRRWKITYVGTMQECEAFTANLHHAIDPNMATAQIDPARVKRVLN
jgi:hypothetical protein